jgi:hypothetical protein
VINEYGPTEGTVWATVFDCAELAGRERVPIGRPIGTARIYVLDRRLQPVPIGVVGEIHIGGAGVAQGYLNLPTLTAERFHEDPFRPGGRMYQSGDLGRWHADGTLEYVGRNDQQVKVRGFRVELGEIEAALARQSGIRDAVVVAREHLGAQRLIGYVTAAPGTVLRVEKLRDGLKSLLPHYMVPAALVVLSELPLTRTGKVDRSALPEPGLDAYETRQYEPPRGEVEEALAEIWCELLQLERVGRHDNFFELGGHSLTIVRMLERLRQRGLHGDVRSVFASESLHELARQIARATIEPQVPPNLIPAGCAAIEPHMLPLISLTPEQIESIVATVPGGAGNVQDIYPLAPLQEGILFHHLVDERGGDAYALPILLALGDRVEGSAAPGSDRVPNGSTARAPTGNERGVRPRRAPEATHAVGCAANGFAAGTAHRTGCCRRAGLGPLVGPALAASHRHRSHRARDHREGGAGVPG